MQNCLAYYTFDLCFQYVLSKWDRSAANASVYNDAHQTDLTMLARKFYLANIGFEACDSLLVLYHHVHYYLAE